MPPDPSPNPSRRGTRVKTAFTISAAGRYQCGMVIFAILAATVVPVPVPASPERQARAMVTIVSNAALRFAEIEKSRPKALRETRVRSADGSLQTVRLVEFE